MQGYIAVSGSASEVPVESRVELFRDPDAVHEVKADVGGDVRGLGVRDATVSRRKGGTPAVVLLPRDRYIEVRNERNSNGVVVDAAEKEVELEKGYATRVKRDATLTIGRTTDLKLTVEREAKVEVDGDYVAGDKVDRSTSVEDSVLNRSNVGAEAAADGSGARPSQAGSVEVDDSVVNRSNVGGGGPAAGGPTGAGRSDASDTQNFCSTHERTYTGEECPDCAAALEYCEGCGAELPDGVTFCPSCGERV